MNALTEFRKKINDLDHKLVAILAKRLDICREVAIYKLGNSVPVMQPNRVLEVKRRNSEIGRDLGLNPEFVMELYDLVIKEACRLEEVAISQAQNGRPLDESAANNARGRE
ncbi:chorismate mutase [Photorhabdus antumapuensis]|uniref:chorismate mutase n=1 Tax=Photorhabdus antumapuensis TaxID=2862867 RepID=UPI001CED2831|nr:chorismate mutase [Photorhabdus antumapuensis]MCA6221499.1 chorismate mutase [Photorhabdus antumapuensis]